jgi:polyribonucleotide nucleotidyltransferase
LIGPGGKTIKKLVADLQVKIDINDNGIVSIMAPDGVSAERAKQAIRAITADPEVGAIYLGTVKKVVDFGAFVELRPGLEGLLHISQLENRKVDRVTDVVNEGEQVLVKVIDVDRQGKIKLSRKDALDKRPTV